MRESLFDFRPRAREIGWNSKRIKLTIGIDVVAKRMIMYDSMVVGYLASPYGSSTISESFIYDF
jgi:hypothetical protein